MSKFRKHEQGPVCPGCDDRLQEGHEDIREFFYLFKHKYPDMHCSWVYRNEEDQDEAFRAGMSKLQFPKSKHNTIPAEAIDIFQISPTGHGIFEPMFGAKLNKEAEESGLNLRWGGTFKKLGDAGHFELKKDA